MTSIFGLVVLVADVWSILQIVQSKKAVEFKILWVALVLILPLIGMILWFLLGSKK